jgi:hypothetical protein
MSLARHQSRGRRTEPIVSLERELVYVLNRMSFLVTEGKRKHVGRRVRFQRDFKDIVTRASIRCFFLQCNAPKEIHAIFKETLG